MAKHLVIVESPAKAKTLGKYLGRDYQVKASVGHVMDLPKSKLGVDIENDFAADYTVIPGKTKILSEIKAAAKDKENVYLAPDPDREGEAIAWHIAEKLGKRRKNVYRVMFNEITKRAVQEAIKNPGQLDKNRYDAQQARRILDRLVGYQLSPLLWKKVRRGLSAGRVQSVSVRIISEREREIRAFVPEEYWTVEARLEAGAPPAFVARLAEVAGQKVDKQFRLDTKARVDEILAGLHETAWTVTKVERKERRRHPTPPFITSRLQQEASRKLGFQPSRTMRIAQRLYEGVELGDEGAVGLITYMRTDSTRISGDALAAVRDFVQKRYGDPYLPAEPNFYRSKKDAQDAHEAIRPTSTEWDPDRVAPFLEREELALYTLIWNRFVASQMTSAVYDATAVDIQAAECRFRATGQILKFDGFMRVYLEGMDDEQPADDEEREGLLPPLTEGETLRLQELVPEQHFTQPPPRYTQATLIKELEEKGIGRPSTYASIVGTILNKEYVVEDEGRRLHATELGLLVTDLLVESFPDVLNVEFTAGMEDELDRIEEGREPWVETMRRFWVPFAKDLERADVEMRDVKREEQPTDLTCEKCGKPMVIKWGRRGEFLACSGYPDCRNTTNFTRDEITGAITPVEVEVTDEACEKSGKPMQVRFGRFGKFLGCSGYPECKSVAPLHKPVPTGVTCMVCGQGQLMERRSRRGKLFYSCNRYPDCQAVAWDRPIAEPCPKCAAPFVTEKVTKRYGTVRRCIKDDCGWQTQVDTDDGESYAPLPERRRGGAGPAAWHAGGGEGQGQGQGGGEDEEQDDRRRHGPTHHPPGRTPTQAGVVVSERVQVIGGGLAGCEAAWQLARAGVPVDLWEMRPERGTAAHTTDRLGELVCSNSFRNATLGTAVGLLKEEMRRLGSLVMRIADAHQVPAGACLAVDRNHFAEALTRAMEDEPAIRLVRREVTAIPDGWTILATGPLTSPALSEALAAVLGTQHLYFYDAIAPTITTDSLDMTVAWKAARYDKGGDDYVNCPLDREQYYAFVDAVLAAEKVPTREFERCVYFEGCMPIEEMARRGRDTLAFGPMRPVGLTDPRTGRRPYACVQLRQDDAVGRLWNVVGFQTKMTYPGQQRRVFRMIPGLTRAEFVRLGSLHRNTFVDSPELLLPSLQVATHKRLLLAGQIVGVEGYVESAATGQLAGLNVARLLRGEVPLVPPRSTSLGSLLAYITQRGKKGFQPMNANYGLFPPLARPLRGRDKKLALADRALDTLARWQTEYGVGRAARRIGLRRLMALATADRIAAVVDVGSNSVLLLVMAVDVSGRARVIDDALATTRLGTGLCPGGTLDASAATRTREAAVGFVARARAAGARDVWLFATGAARAAADGAAFAEGLAAAAGAPVEILSGEREAALAYAAVADDDDRLLLVVDVGGMTTELTLGRGVTRLVSVSLPLGALTLTEAGAGAPARIDAVLATTDVPARARTGGAEMVATGGSATALAAVDLQLPVYDGRRVHGHRVAVAALPRLAVPAAGVTLDPGRAEILGAGALVLRAVARAAGRTTFRVSDHAVRHALLRERLRAAGVRVDP